VLFSKRKKGANEPIAGSMNTILKIFILRPNLTTLKTKKKRTVVTIIRRVIEVTEKQLLAKIELTRKGIAKVT